MPKPTHEDAALLVQLAQLQVSMVPHEGADNVLSGNFPKTIEAIRAKYPDENDPTWRQIWGMLTWGETVGTLVRQGLFNEDLALNWIWFEGYWGQVAPVAKAMRAEEGVPALYENFEWLAGRSSD